MADHAARRPRYFTAEAPFGAFAPGHFYSPLPSRDEIVRRDHQIFGEGTRVLPGIDLNEEAQLALVDRIQGWYPEHPFPVRQTSQRRYWFENPRFAAADALALYGVLRHATPRRVIEVGSGFSSCAMLDVNDACLDGRVEFTFLEPFPDTLLANLREEDHGRVEVRALPVQDIPVELFGTLEEDDVLFIDSTHVAKIGSDVNRLFLDVLPALRPGVYVHVHDIFYPFEYPREWIDDGRAWNEAYLLRAFLACNRDFEIVLWNDWLRVCRPDALQAMPAWRDAGGGSIWLRRVR
jgi:hypothetical protein